MSTMTPAERARMKLIHQDVHTAMAVMLTAMNATRLDLVASYVDDAERDGVELLSVALIAAYSMTLLDAVPEVFRADVHHMVQVARAKMHLKVQRSDEVPS